MADHARLYADEVADIAAFLRDLSAEQWEHPSLCAEFTVRLVVSHMLSAAETSPFGVLRRLPGAGFDPDRVVAALARERADGPTTAELIDDFEALDPKQGVTRLFPLRSTFLERVVHHQDMRRPLGMPRPIPEERLVAALEVATSGHNGVNSRKRAAGLALQATDVEWSHGSGPRVEGSGEAIMMAVCGRTVAVDDLTGDGVSTLRSRQP